MGELIAFPTREPPASARASAPPTFFFDVGDAFSYLASERVERLLGRVEWVALDAGALGDPAASRVHRAARRAEAEAHASALRLPLVWPETRSLRAPGTRRASALACELGAGPAFALAASRLSFCGGFELDDPEALAEAAAAAGLPLAACRQAAGEAWRDEELRETARQLTAHGIVELPALCVEGAWVQGEAGLMQAAGLIASCRRRA